MPNSAESFDRSLWSSTAAERPLATPPLADREAEVAVIGGGFTGLSAALHLARRTVDVVLLESREIGWGGSGRNGGQVIPGLKHDPDELVATFGEDAGRVLVQLSGTAADLVFELVDEYRIDCAPARRGWVQGAHSSTALPAVLRRARQWQALGAPVKLFDRDAIAACTGTHEYAGGWLDGRAGTVNPLAYARGLARAAAGLGAAVHQRSPVESLRRDGDRWVVATPGGRVRARHVILATDAYTDALWPGLARTLLTVQSILVATEPLPPDVRASVLPGCSCVSETRKLAFYYRLSPDGRLVFGGRGAIGDDEKPGYWTRLVDRMHRFFPQAANVAVERRWSGQVGLTLDGLPHVHQPAPGLVVGLGYNGRGVAMATALGATVADMVLTRSARFPVSTVQPIAWHAVRRPAMGAGIAYYWLKDRLGFAS